MKENILVALISLFGICQSFSNVGSVRPQSGVTSRRLGALRMVMDVFFEKAAKRKKNSSNSHVTGSGRPFTHPTKECQQPSLKRGTRAALDLLHH